MLGSLSSSFVNSSTFFSVARFFSNTVRLGKFVVCSKEMKQVQLCKKKKRGTFKKSLQSPAVEGNNSNEILLIGIVVNTDVVDKYE